jgi:Short repeat of unknown function (DUF308)
MSNLRSALIWRGVLAVIIGVVAVAWPGITVGAIVILFAVDAFLAAISDLGLAFRADRAGPVIGYIVLAVLCAVAGVYALASPAITALVLTIFVAVWAFVTGIIEVVMARRRRGGASAAAGWWWGWVSMRPNRSSAPSMIRSALAGFAMSPSTVSTPGSSDSLIVRALATTAQPRPRYPATRPAPMP